MAALDQTDEPYQDLFRMLLLTGVRIGNLLAARFDQFDLVMGVWHIPGSQHKNKAPHTVPLLAEAIEIVQRRRKQLRSDLFGCGPAQRARRDT